jgi:pantoate--beta-alanine ligase
MKVIKSIIEMRNIADRHRATGQKIAVVPTMGYLHSGHTSLIRIGKHNADIVITTLFVNPTQFAPDEDFSKYPRDFEHDFNLAKDNGCDYLFFPEVREMYPKGNSTSVIVSKVSEKFEGIFRPTHFEGVATIVAKLFNASRPDIAIFGQKDFQQTLVIRRMAEDLNFGIEIIIAPTIREFDGLAMSSRNVYLSVDDRKRAIILFLALEEAKKEIAKGMRDRKFINATMIKTLRSVQEIKIDYAVSANADNLDEPDFFLPGEKIVLLLACYLGRTRLIDNSLISIPYSLNESNFIEGI